jgi:cytosine/adenosine deaminase-related metal-dependent hydrolase
MESGEAPKLIAADAVMPMDPALPQVLRQAGIVVADGRIVAVGEVGELRRQYGKLEGKVERGILLPGFVNAHTHLELSYQSAEARKAGHFTGWVSGLMASYPGPEELDATIRAATRRGVDESLRAGVTTIGDISRQAAITRSEIGALAARGVVPRVVSFGEVMGLGKLRERGAGMIDAALAVPAGMPATMVLGISPHAPYSVEGPVLRACVREAVLKSAPMAMHLAENMEEIEFLSDLAGPFGPEWDVMQRLDLIDERIPLMPGGPIRWAQRWGLLLADAADPKPRRFPVLLAHVNYCDKGELAQLSVSRASVAYCPRTHEYFGHPPHRYRDMLESGVNVCLGTDSRASNPDLSVLREAQRLVQRDGFDAYEALAMMTRRGAEALGMKDAGTLSVGKFADAVLVQGGAGEDAAETIIRAAALPAKVWVGGRQA